ncbi:MAG: hypothetical protein Q9162_005085 [Coniocarpon cinnabarinum]
MASLDSATGQPLPPQAIQRVLYITPRVHVYQIPPLTSNKGYVAATWTNNPPIFTARLRVIETSVPKDDSEQVSNAILLEDGSSGELFAAAPYHHPIVVTQATDSSRFFAVRVVGDGGRKATLGLGFEERSDAFDFGVTLQDARKTLGLDGGNSSNAATSVKQQTKTETPRDYSLKEGQTITINIGDHGAKARESQAASAGQTDAKARILPPPPSTATLKKEMNISETHPFKSDTTRNTTHSIPNAKDLGFDDGEFGEFQ